MPLKSVSKIREKSKVFALGAELGRRTKWDGSRTLTNCVSGPVTVFVKVEFWSEPAKRSGDWRASVLDCNERDNAKV